MVHANVIKRFEVSQLFGLHDYVLHFGVEAEGEVLHESLLYGDNGTGKTTVLKLMYHTLSKRKGAGSRSFVSRTPFKRIFLELTSGEWIECIKDEEQRLTFSDGKTATTIILKPDPDDGAIKGSANPELVLYEDFLTGLNIEQLYLSDDRTILSSYQRLNRRRRLQQRARLEEDDHSIDAPELDNIDLAALGLHVRDIIRDKLIDSSAYGQSNVNNIYLDLAKRLSRPFALPDRKQTLTDIEQRVKTISSDYHTASLLEIFPKVDFEEFVQVARDSGDQQANALAVIETFLDTIEAQVTPVKFLAQLINDLVDEINSYFVNKRLTFSIRSGFKIFSGAKLKRLRFGDLSSGEKQLLFLILISFVTRDDKSIVYIDEPELSLNIKWQRQLVSSILKVISGTETQLIAATHSFEILAAHREAIIDLNRMQTSEPETHSQ